MASAVEKQPVEKKGPSSLDTEQQVIDLDETSSIVSQIPERKLSWVSLRRLGSGPAAAGRLKMVAQGSSLKLICHSSHRSRQLSSF